MKTRILTALAIATLFFGCVTSEPASNPQRPGIDPIPTARGQVALRIAASANSPFFTLAHRAQAIVASGDMDSIFADLEVENGTISGSIDNIPVGNNRYITISVYDVENTLQYYGSASATVIANQQTLVSLTLFRMSGTIVIETEVVDPPPLSTIQESTAMINVPATTISADSLWFDTGIDVIGGMGLVIQASGTWNLAFDPRSCDANGLSGWGNFGNFRYGALVGKIGQSGPTILIGASYTDTVSRTGRLYLANNDDRAIDNSGSLQVTISAFSSFPKWCIETSNCGTFVDARDEQIYTWTKIGSQIWMAENLNYDTLGSSCYANDSINCAIYGRLYNWNSAMAGKGTSLIPNSMGQDICPQGWHIPTDDEWKHLEAFIGIPLSDLDRTRWRGTTEHTKLKANSQLWGTFLGTNDYGFSALPAGTFYPDRHTNLGSDAHWWTSTSLRNNYAFRRYLRSGETGIDRSDMLFQYEISVRCVKD